MNLKIKVEREAGSQWIAEVMELPGCMAYGKTQALALRVLANRMEHGEAK